MKAELATATKDLHEVIQAALTNFTDKTGMRISSTRWDVAEVLNVKGDGTDARYLLLRSVMETRPS